jgi:MoaA/NifB/PqqE/SkfB family radical SAM enzyme
MYRFEQVKSIHFEVTSKCQAKCPMCPRRINGGILNPFITLNEVSLEQFKSWFNPEFIQQIYYLNMCGNLGDPIIAQDTLKIYEYLRLNNSNMTLAMDTNGSARNIYWWKELAKLKIKVTFGIDGLEDTHKLYRINTDWNTIIKNATAFIQAGGEANWHMLAFKHNQHQVDECRDLATALGFKDFKVMHTSRFQDRKFNVLDDLGKTIYILYPTDRSKNMIPIMKESVKKIKPQIECKSKRDLQFYVSSNGDISPCCWLDFNWISPRQDTRIDYMDTIGELPNLNKNTLKEIFESGYFNQIENTWKDKPLMECSKQCGNFDKLGSQFDHDSEDTQQIQPN